jgi:hypothetical protein
VKFYENYEKHNKADIGRIASGRVKPVKTTRLQ